jgi:hypothetical protein
MRSKKKLLHHPHHPHQKDRAIDGFYERCACGGTSEARAERRGKKKKKKKKKKKTKKKKIMV